MKKNVKKRQDEANKAENLDEAKNLITEKEKSDKKPVDAVSIAELFKYSDGLDKLLIVLGTLFALVSAFVYPLMFWTYGRIATTLVDLQKLNGPQLNITDDVDDNATNLTNICFDKLSIDTNFNTRIEDNIKYQILFGVASILANYLAYVCFQCAAERQIKRIRNLLFKSILSQEMGFFDRKSPGELNSIISSNIQSLEVGMGFKIGDFISAMAKALICFVFAMVSAWKFAIVFLAILPFISILMAMMIMFVKKNTIKELESYQMAGKIAQQVLSSIRTVYSLGSMKHDVRKYTDNLSKAEELSNRKGLISGIFFGLINGLFNSCFAVAFIYGTYLARENCGTLTPGDIIKSLMLMINTTFLTGQAMPFLKEFVESRAAARSVFDIIDKKSEISIYDKEGKKKNATCISGELSLENVHFYYPQRKDVNVLKGVTLKIPAGKTVALCGSSGCGKSTIIQLLQRFYDPTEGAVKVDDVNIAEYDLEWIRSQMSLVSQEPVLFSTTIRENIRLGRLDATDEEIQNAAKSANAHDFIMSYPDNYNTLVGERGGQLSGGQKQRIAIARAILKNPKILLLDEATSALDYESERVVQNALDNAKIGRTTIIVAHRLTTIRNADLIVGLADGEVKEIGTHQELIERRGIYHQLVTSQTSTEKNVDVADLTRLGANRADSIEHPPAQETEKLKFDVDSEIKTTQNDRNSFTDSLRMWKYHRPELFYVILGSVCQLICGFLNPASSLIFCEIYAIFATQDVDEQKRVSFQYSMFILALAGVNLVTTFVLNYSFSLVGNRLTKRVRVKTFASLLRQEVAFHDLEENKSSYLTSQLSGSIPLCKGITSDMLNITCQALSSVGFSIVVSLLINWRLSLVIMAFIPINFLTGFMHSQNINMKKSKGRNNEEETARIATETVENIKTVVSLCREDYFYDHFKRVFDQKFTKKLLTVNVQGLFYSISNSALFFIQAIAFSYGYYLIKSGDLTVPNLYRVYATITFSSMMLGRIFSLKPDTNKAREACQKALRIIDRRSKIDSMSEEGARPESLKGDIRFKNVIFNYPNRANLRVLDDFSLHVRPGDINALVGHSGCGKSTTISLLMRFYDVDGGSIELDGVDIRQLNINWLRAHIGLVSQEPVLFDVSIRENISYGRIDDPNIPMTDIMAAAKAANISERIENLPEKYDTMVGTKGSQLSGGEKQRVAIARALMRNPRILLLDEATSALDNESEKIVQNALDNAQQGKTCIVIAHRLSTIRDANKISVISKGGVVEEGTHADLIQRKGHYYRLQVEKNASS